MGEVTMNTATISNDTPIWQLTVEQLKEVLSSVHQPTITDFTPTSGKTYEHGIDGICRIFNCSPTTASRYKKDILGPAIIQSAIGGKFQVDVDHALELMRKHKESE